MGQYIILELQDGVGRLLLVDESKSIKFLVKIAKLREIYIEKVKQEIGGEPALIFLGIFIGSREIYNNKPLFSLIKATGLQHIFVASGFNVSIISRYLIFLQFIVGSFLYKSISIVFIVLYSFLVGFEVPILRASVMAIVQILTYENIKNSFHVLFMVGFIFLLFKPVLFYDVSFQLSFMATFSIIFFNWIKNSSTQKNFSIINEILLSIFIFIFILPIISYAFGEVNFMGVIATPIISILLPMIMFLGTMSFVLSDVLISRLLFYVCDFLVFVMSTLNILLPSMTLQFELQTYSVGLFYALVFGVCFLIKKIYAKT